MSFSPRITNAELAEARLRDQLDVQQDLTLRKQYITALLTAGFKLKFQQPTISLAAAYLHIFLTRVSYKLLDAPRLLLGACLFLAGKVCETSRKPRDITNVLHATLNPSAPILKVNEVMNTERKKLISNEQLLLRVLAYHVDVELPYQHLFNLLKLLNAPAMLAQAALNIMNDSIIHPFFLLENPAEYAASCVFLAKKIVNMSGILNEPDQPNWLDVVEVPVEKVEAICFSLLKQYS